MFGRTPVRNGGLLGRAARDKENIRSHLKHQSHCLHKELLSCSASPFTGLAQLI